jgi:hypothetical protein
MDATMLNMHPDERNLIATGTSGRERIVRTRLAVAAS